MQFESLTFRSKDAADAFIKRMETGIRNEQGEKFHITDSKRCDWLIKKFTSINDEIERLEKQHTRRIKQLENEEQFLKNRFGRELEGFVRAHLDGSRKSIDFPHGRAGFRKTRETVEIVDQEAAVNWAKENCFEALRKKEWTIKTPLIKYLRDTGVIPDGCEHEPAKDKFYID